MRVEDFFVGLFLYIVSIFSFGDGFFLGFRVDVVDSIVVNGIFDYIGFFEGFIIGGDDLIIVK